MRHSKTFYSIPSMYSVHLCFCLHLDILHNDFYMVAASHWDTDERWAEPLPGRTFCVFLEHSRDWRQIEHLSLYVTFRFAEHYQRWYLFVLEESLVEMRNNCKAQSKQQVPSGRNFFFLHFFFGIVHPAEACWCSSIRVSECPHYTGPAGTDQPH